MSPRPVVVTAAPAARLRDDDQLRHAYLGF